MCFSTATSTIVVLNSLDPTLLTSDTDLSYLSSFYFFFAFFILANIWAHVSGYYPDSHQQAGGDGDKPTDEGERQILVTTPGKAFANRTPRQTESMLTHTSIFSSGFVKYWAGHSCNIVYCSGHLKGEWGNGEGCRGSPGHHLGWSILQPRLGLFSLLWGGESDGGVQNYEGIFSSWQMHL